VAIIDLIAELRYEYAMWNRRSDGSRCLRRIMAKFTVYDPTISPNSWGSPFTGQELRELTKDEELVRQKIDDGSMALQKANLILEKLDCSVPFRTRVEFIESLAALVSVHGKEVKKVAKGANRPLYKILHTAAAWQRVEWYFNNIRLKYMISPSKHGLLPVGTTSNEALHAEINGWFRQTVAMHQETCQELERYT